jgi:uncharacterized protein DUF3455
MGRMTRSGKRMVLAAGMAAVAITVGAVSYQASAAEVGAEAIGPAAARSNSAIAPPAGLRILGVFGVVSGTQTYTCANKTFVGTASTPEAQLAGPRGRIHHFAGPSWQSVRDGSLVTAAKVAESPVTGAIPELLLEVKTHTGSGLLSKATNIQRLRTSGGTAPTAACTDGAKAVVPYRALYVFWGK